MTATGSIETQDEASPAEPGLGGTATAGTIQLLRTGPVPGLALSDNPFIIPEPAPAPGTAAPAAGQALKGALRRRDAEIGLGPDGPLIRALRDATYASLAPIHGRATFAITLDDRGALLALRLVSSEGDTFGWEDTRRRAAELLEGMTFNVRGAGGAELRIEVTSTMTARPEGPVAGAGAILFLQPDELVKMPRRLVHLRLTSLE